MDLVKLVLNPLDLLPDGLALLAIQLLAAAPAIRRCARLVIAASISRSRTNSPPVVGGLRL